MKQLPTLFFFSLAFLSACYTPHYYAKKGDYDKAIDLYCSNISAQRKAKKKDIVDLESSFALVQQRDTARLALLAIENKPENWPEINAIHRNILARQEKIAVIQGKGYNLQGPFVSQIDSLQKDSRHRAATYIYAHAKQGLAITLATGQRQPARDAYYALRHLKAHYYPFWENTSQLIDSAYQAGKAHILMVSSVQEGVSDGETFWQNVPFPKNFVDNEWLVFYTDTHARTRFDYIAKCRLVSLFVGPENADKSERTETKEVEDGYAEKLDSNGHVISRTQKYRTETTTITTYRSSRMANGTVVIELLDQNNGQVALLSRSIHGDYNFDESSETSAPTCPTYWGMIQRVADDIAIQLRQQLKKAVLRSNTQG